MQDGQERAAPDDLLDALATRVRDLGREHGLPYVAAAGDISSPEPLRDPRGRPFAESLFRWVDPKLQYWKNRSFGLHAPFVAAVRYTSEPFYYHDGRFASWRPAPRLEAIEVAESAEAHGVRAALIAPVYLPAGVLGAVVWAAPERRPDLPDVFRAAADAFHMAALRFIAACHDRAGWPQEAARLTRREVQCLKCAAAGQTDLEIARALGISAPTVRFHLRNAAGKLGVVGRAQAIHRATTLGYIGLASRGPGAPALARAGAG